MLVGVVRSGLVESVHPVGVAVIGPRGEVVLRSEPDADRPFFMRSAAKPFQAAVAQANGAGMGPEQTAVASGSHGGEPVHVAYVRSMLAEVGLGEQHLACPPAWPLDEGAARGAASAGVGAPQRVFHNCSGKHAGMLRACAARGWPLTYVDPGHPLQREIAAAMADATGGPAEPAGIDGCGVPTFRATVAALAAAYARLATDPSLAEVAGAMYRFASLTADGERAEAQLSRWCHAAVKGGAQGCLGVAWFGGIGVAAKSWSGQGEPAMVAVIAVLRSLGVLPDHGHEMLGEAAHPAVLGGGLPVGRLEVLEGPA